MNNEQYPGEFQGSTYVETISDDLRIIIGSSDDNFDNPTCFWEVQRFYPEIAAIEGESGWHRMNSSPKRRMMAFDHALNLARDEARLIQKEIENPHKPNNWTMRGK